MAMSQALMSASEIDLPRPGVSASAVLAPNASKSAREMICLHVDMFDLPLAVDGPARDAVVMLVGECERVGERRAGLSTHGDKLRARGLHVAGLVPGAALQHHRLAVPAPGH